MQVNPLKTKQTNTNITEQVTNTKKSTRHGLQFIPEHNQHWKKK